MLVGKKLLVIGARAGGYGASIAEAAIRAGATVFGTSLDPESSREAAFFQELGATLVPVPLKYGFEQRKQVFDELAAIEAWLRAQGVERLDAVVHTVAGGFPRQPAVMKSVADILKGRQTFFDMATAVKRNVYYVNAGSFDDTIRGLAGITHEETQYLALTYRGDLPYFIGHTKRFLERLAERRAREGKRTLIAALPEAWTQSSQFFTGIEVAIIHNYLAFLKPGFETSEDLSTAYSEMQRSLAELEGFEPLMEELKRFLEDQWRDVRASSGQAALYQAVEGLFRGLRAKGVFSTLRRAVEIISDFVRQACGTIVVRDFLAGNRFDAGDVRQVFYRDLTGKTTIEKAAPVPTEPPKPTVRRRWKVYDKDEVRKTLSMYGENFLFLDRVVMEDAEIYDGITGVGRFTVPTPEHNPILKDHFVGIPVFAGHLQMEAVAQLATFMIRKLMKDKRVVPILTGTEFPDLNTMAPPGETLTIMGAIRMPERRVLSFEAFIENRFARSKGTIRGMVLNERVVRKMLESFQTGEMDE